MDLAYEQMEGLNAEFGSSFFLLDVNKLKRNYQKIDHAFRSRYQNFIIGYSYKTNYLPYLCKELDQLGAYAEVVSRLEYDLAVKIGVNPQNIIFNGPLKMSEDIETALENESTLNLDSFYEIEYVKNYCLKNKLKPVKVGLRVNFDLSSNGESPLQEGYEVSRFGFCVSNGSFHSAVQRLKECENIQIVGLHGHFSTRERKVETYGTITRKLCELAKQYIPDSVEYIDIGGGIYGELPASFKLKAPSFEDYAETVCHIMNIEFEEQGRKPYLIVEPGISMVANAFTFISKVIETKKVQDKYFVLIDGSVHNVKPTMHKRNLPMRLVFQHPDSTPHATYNIVGYTCMEKDYLGYELVGQLPIKDDYVIFENVGAYTIVFNPPFIKERPGIVAFENEEFYIIRKKESMKEFFNEDLYVFKKPRTEVPK
ncbi:diaminopimelate decarboxylase [Bacillus sp. SORGH_AS 510]|uniref:diaminopimelate decarboxylase n=1 Tax=Bacillus sp. SORGH_AS_0510 TaxID=3041771 RepID=UPI0027833591|nr:diaminopimelate decarboxylase [Bacillus sp. SORGH_AS_0510]MDQ1144594.1 diaminopimelate decarboxylase [Bacillus sp. SORGH_AS_0510]